LLSTEVQERDKPNPTALGKILRVDDLYTYHDLDDLIVSHIGEIVSKGDQLIRSDKFKGRNIEELRSSPSFSHISLLLSDLPLLGPTC
jgi:transcription elongation factor SPT6